MRGGCVGAVWCRRVTTFDRDGGEGSKRAKGFEKGGGVGDVGGGGGVGGREIDRGRGDDVEELKRLAAAEAEARRRRRRRRRGR